MRAHEFIIEATKLSQDVIDSVKAKWDEGKTPIQIANELGFKREKVINILSRYYPDRPGKSRLDQETIDLVKLDWDSGKTPKEIAANLNIDLRTVGGILNRYYPDRGGKRIEFAKALNDEDKANMVIAFMDGKSPTEISSEYDLSSSTIVGILKDRLGQEYEVEMSRRRTLPGEKISGKMTPEMLDTAIYMYRQGKSTELIADKLGNVEPTSIYNRLKRLSNWPEIRADYERFGKIRQPKQASTNIYRSGVIGNRQHKGPGSKNTSGMFPSKKY